MNMYPTGDKYQSDRSSSICPLGDLNNYKSSISRRSECYKYKIRIRLNLL